MPDPIQSTIANPAEVNRLCTNARPADRRGEDVQVQAPLCWVAQIRARYRDMPDAEVSDVVHNHPRDADALDTLIADMSNTVDAEDGADEEDKDRLIVRPGRGDAVDPDDAVEHGERWSDCE